MAKTAKAWVHYSGTQRTLTRFHLSATLGLSWASADMRRNGLWSDLFPRRSENSISDTTHAL